MKSTGSIILFIILVLTAPTAANRFRAMIATLENQAEHAKDLLDQAWQSQTASGTANDQESVVPLRISFIRAVDGVMLPRKIIRGGGGRINAEWATERCAIKLPIEPEKLDLKIIIMRPDSHPVFRAEQSFLPFPGLDLGICSVSSGKTRDHLSRSEIK